MGKLISPTFFTAAPSTKLSIWDKVITLSCLRDSYIAGAPAGSTPMIFVLGLNDLNTIPQPAIRPPPPIGAMR